MATWTLKQAKDHLSAIVDRALAGEAQEIVRRGDEPVMVIAKSAVAPPARGSILSALIKHSELEFDIPSDRATRRCAPKL
ncbi:MAG TPA: type II toxin-antitoxin system Phd/YefM family antitoxin [Candidatus Aquilonibacter sp.]|nr:type II toxin-antitoxin system Phd/YefM family antitoxin [Candidatus Aquilonibacter sp.]